MDLVMEECLEIDPRPEAVREGRRFAERVLTAWELSEFVTDAVLVASELLGNAVLHARTDVRLTLRAGEGPGLRIEVLDQNSRMPMAVACPEDATSGRGLALVGRLASRWGTEPRPDGKVVWAEIGKQDVESDPDCFDLRASDSVDEALEAARQGMLSERE